MTYDSSLHALADPTRRQIFLVLSATPRSVTEIASVLPVSRPAVSQHLAVLKSAGLVTMEVAGTRHVYRRAPDGLAALRAWIDGFWDDPLAAFVRHAEQERTKTMTDPVVKTVTLPVSPARAFEMFTAEIAAWWPLDSHSLSAGAGKVARHVAIDPRAGGAITETLHDGTTAPWGHVTDWAPGLRLGIAWHVGRPATEATSIAITFLAVDAGTRVTLVHSGWEVLGDAAGTVRNGYQTGWDRVLCTCFADAARPQEAPTTT
jgi:DNA-binding transcriptional ArsR family regulator/uncharacterized protein YndB with AHSA1/START domain